VADGGFGEFAVVEAADLGMQVERWAVGNHSGAGILFFPLPVLRGRARVGVRAK
jgi:hypothetical protein